MSNRVPTATITALAIVTLFMGFASAAAASPGAFEELLRGRIEALRHDSDSMPGHGELAATELVAGLYEQNGFQPLWQAPGRAASLFGVISGAWQEGLDPGDYHYAALSPLLGSTSGATIDAVRRELLLSDAFFRLAFHFHYGRVDPTTLSARWNFDRELVSGGPRALIIRALADNTIQTTLQSLLPDTPYYRGLRQALAEYRELQARGGWQNLPPGPLLKPGAKHPQIPLLRERLRTEVKVSLPVPPSPETYDSLLEQAVITFQLAHGLKGDAIVGPATRQELNYSVAQRIDQIAANMERLRWVFDSLPDEYLLVDIAGFTVRLIRDRQPVWETRAIVGRPYRQTALFRATMSYLVINPTWTVPPTIMRKDIWPKLEQDRSVLQEKNLQIIDLEGRVIDPDSLDWSKLSARHFPYQLRQAPGPHNALGRIKFMFPNSNFIYLHDTPAKNLFDKSQRAFSSGCIRIQNPLELGEIVLQPNGGWTQARLQAEIDSGVTKTVRLEQKIPVIIVYFTAVATDSDALHFRPDLYQRDARVIQALAQKPH